MDLPFDYPSQRLFALQSDRHQPDQLYELPKRFFWINYCPMNQLEYSQKVDFLGKKADEFEKEELAAVHKTIESFEKKEDVFFGQMKRTSLLDIKRRMKKKTEILDLGTEMAILELNREIQSSKNN